MITFNETTKTFHLSNKEISYIMKLDDNKHLLHLYFAKKIHNADNDDQLFFGHLDNQLFNGDRLLNSYRPKEYGSYGTGDFREPAFVIRQEDGNSISDFSYISHEIYQGKKSIAPLPSIYVEDEQEAQTLEITLHDSLTNTDLILYYTIYRDYPVIARHSAFIHKGDTPIYIQRVMSMQLDLADSDYDFIHFSGAWGREKRIVSNKLRWGNQSIFSTKGVSSAEHNPTFILKRPDTTEDFGQAYGFAFIYSGNFLCEADVSTYNQCRVNVGIHPVNFSWKLCSGEEFVSPEAIVMYSDKGLTQMSHNFHNLFNQRLCRGKYRGANRPILLNNWEATEMTFDEDKIMSIAQKAKEAGAELFVLDDGWFGTRNDETQGLGDWFANTTKLPSGISGLSQKVAELGIKFGLWFEPEMVNKNSQLYREHPDYLLQVKNRHSHSFRYQYVLDFSRDDVVNYIYQQMKEIISTSKMSYIKWDMNRYLTEVYSVGLAPDEQGKVFHKYILGVYSLYHRLTQEFPDILFESCSSGGARFDPGILYYAPQTWCSDNTDANDRVEIQYANSFFYPISSHGAHVSAVPNQQTTRVTDIHTRANIAYFGAFGYELDLNELSEDEFKIVQQQIAFYKENRAVFQYGTYYRLRCPFENNSGSFMTVSPDGQKAFAMYYQRLYKPNTEFVNLKLKGLEAETKYQVTLAGIDKIYYGDYLMNAGISFNSTRLARMGGDFTALLIEITKI